MAGLSRARPQRARQATQALGCWLAAALAPAPAQAALRKPPPAMAPQPAPIVAPRFADAESLRFAVLQARAQAEVLQDPAAADERIEVYFERAEGERGARTVRVSVDGGTPLVLALDDSAADSASAGALRRVGRVGLSTGAHRMHVEVTGGSTDGDAGPLAQDVGFSKDRGALALVLRPRAGGLVRPGGIALSPWRAAPANRPAPALLGPEVLSLVGSTRLYTEGGDDDPRLRDARGLLDAGRADDALIELWGLAQRAAVPADLPADYWLASAQALRAAGLLDHAEALTQTLSARRLDADKVAVEQLHLADAEFEAGRFDRAQALLDRCHPALPGHLDPDWRFQQAQLLFERNQTDGALRVLRIANSDDVEAFRYLVDADAALRAASYRRFNLAVALLAHNRNQLGLSWLDLVGRYQGRDRDLQMLRDRANLTMGWRLLKLGEGRSAMAALGRVSSEGPYANAALLGDGWCQLAPAGRSLARASLGNEQADAPDPFGNLAPAMRHSLEQLHVLEPELNGEFGPPSFMKMRPPANHEQALHRARNIWEILAARDVDDPAVQEALVAIAYVTGQLGNRQRSWDAYSVAFSRLAGVQAELDRNLAYVRQGGLAREIGQARDLRTLYLVMDRLRLPPGDATRGLYGAVARYRDGQGEVAALERVQRMLAGLPGAAPAHLRVTLPGLLLAVRQQQAMDARQIEALALQQLQGRRHTLQRYVVATSGAMMRFADAAAPPARAEALTRAGGDGS